MDRSAQAARILDRIAADTYTERDLAQLRRLITVSGDHNTVQVGRYNVRLDQAHNIHIGDRIYRGADAEMIRSVLADIEPTGRGSLRGLSGVVITVGTLIALTGMGMFFYAIVTIASSPTNPSGFPPDIITGFAVVFVGIVVIGLGQLIHGWERPRHDRRG